MALTGPVEVVRAFYNALELLTIGRFLLWRITL